VIGVSHVLRYMRVDTRTQYPNAGIGPILRARSRSGTTGLMAEGVEIDLAKLRQLVIEHTGEGRSFSRRSLSLAATNGRNPDLIRDIMRVDKRKPTIESVSGICKALGVPLSSVVKGVDLTAESLTEWLTVSGAVAAGVWREQVDWPRDDWYEIEVDINTEPGSHVGVVVEGRSMDKVLPPGTILRCVDLIGSDLEPQDGDYVIVEQKRGSLYETTVKRLSRRPDGDWELCAESTLPEFRDPIFIGKPGDPASGRFDGMDDTTRVKAIVIDAFLPLRRRRTRQIASG
jgi:SOS-response transcriptional repressor LexA